MQLCALNFKGENLHFFKFCVYPTKFPNDLFSHLHLNSESSLFISRNLKSLLHKQPFITAHFHSSVHILCITAHFVHHCSLHVKTSSVLLPYRRNVYTSLVLL